MVRGILDTSWDWFSKGWSLPLLLWGLSQRTWSSTSQGVVTQRLGNSRFWRWIWGWCYKHLASKIQESANHLPWPGKSLELLAAKANSVKAEKPCSTHLWSFLPTVMTGSSPKGSCVSARSYRQDKAEETPSNTSNTRNEAYDKWQQCLATKIRGCLLLQHSRRWHCRL